MEDLLPLYVLIPVSIVGIFVSIFCLKYLFNSIKEVSKDDTISLNPMEADDYNREFLKAVICYSVLISTFFITTLNPLYGLVAGVECIFLFVFFFKYLFKYDKEMCRKLYKLKEVSNINMFILVDLPYFYSILVLGSCFPVIGHIIIFLITFTKHTFITNRCENCNSTSWDQEEIDNGYIYRHFTERTEEERLEPIGGGEYRKVRIIKTRPLTKRYHSYTKVFKCRNCGYTWSYNYNHFYVHHEYGPYKVREESY